VRVVILSQYYDPEPVPKLGDLARGMTERGHQVTVVTGFPNYPNGTLYPGYSIRPWSVEVVDGIRIVRLALYPDHSRSTARRIANYVSFGLSASILGPWLAGAADVIYVWHPPLTIGMAALAISMVRRAPVVYAVHDLWPEMAVAAGMLKQGVAVRMLELFERFVYRRAAVVGVVSPAFVDHLMVKGVPKGKIEVLTDWVDDSMYRPVRKDSNLSDQLGMTDKFNVVFAGQLGAAQHLETVLEAARLLESRPEVQFLLVGDGVELAGLQQKAAEMHLKNVRFAGRFPVAEMPSIYALADVLLVHLKADSAFEMSIPGKTYTYMACSKPVLVAAAGVTADLIRNASAGLTCAPDDPQALAETVIRFVEMPSDERARMGDAGRHTVVTTYARSILLDKHERVLVAAAQRGAKGMRREGL
jgi:colanic acid biosynthesis glycosyl transferase WcaI